MTPSAERTDPDRTDAGTPTGHGAPTDPGPLDLRAPLPTGLTVIEASAGTGKTYALAGLAVRAVAERGLAPSELCIVTFTEAATAELRGRVRSRLVEAAAHLAAGAPDTSDAVLYAVGTEQGEPLDELERERRHRNLVAAVADFDAATISTIHGFASRVVASGGGSSGAITDDDTDIRELVVDRFLHDLGHVAPVPFKVDEVLKAVKLRLRMPSARMFTLDCDAWEQRAGKKISAQARVRAPMLDEAAALVDGLVDDVRRRRRTERRRTFDGLIAEARAALSGPAAPGIVAALRKRFSLVMIDEFQDTDAVQWDIFRQAFLDGPLAPVDTVIVGDPKQSIYRFRSAELSAYLTALTYARAHGGSIVGLDTNWRTDAPLLDALALLFDGVTFGDPSVAFRRVAGAPGRDDSRVVDNGPGADGSVLQFRHRPGDDATAEARAGVRRDLVGEVVRLLEHGEVLDEQGRRPLQASDIGILVRSNADADAYAEALAAAGVPAARSSGDSVLDSAAARQWRTLLVALDRPTSVGAARAAALGWFVADDAASMVDLDDDGRAELVEQLRRWAALLADRGLPALLGALRGAGLAARVLARPSGERDLTDLDHVAELLNTASGGRRTSPAALLGVLDEMARSGTTVADEEGVASELLARRIDRDDETVKILTVHKAKGLEFSVVLCPTMWTKTSAGRDIGHGWIDDARYVNTNALPTATAGASAGPVKVVAQRNAVENCDEARRLLYVALTRAKHRLVVWWARPQGSWKSELERVLEHACGGDVDLPALAARSGGRISMVELVPFSGPGRFHRPSQPRELAAATAHRRLDRTWAVWSFTGIEQAAHALGAHRSPDPGRPAPQLPELMALPPDLPIEGGNDEPGGTPSDDEPAAAGAGLALRDLAGGRAFGTLVHSVLEHTDFGSPTLAADLESRCAEALRYRPLPVEGEVLAEGLVGALHAPLGGPLGPLRLVDLRRPDRLDELSFDAPLGRLSAARVAGALLDHLPDGDPLVAWAERAAAGGLAVDVEGMVTGSIDLVARTGDGRFWLADYKTNRLRGTDYDEAAMASAMADNGYPLQATLYLVALHRYLRWRLAGRYDPERQLLGAAYLFVRGMDPGRAADDTRGVFWWRPPVAALDAVDRLLATGRVAS